MIKINKLPELFDRSITILRHLLHKYTLCSISYYVYKTVTVQYSYTIGGLSGKSPAIDNIMRKVCMTSM